MWLFDLFKKKSAPKTEHAETNSLANASKIDRLWERWKRNGVPSPYRELMTLYYEMEKEINKVGGGMYAYFSRLDAPYVEALCQSVIDLLPHTYIAANFEDALRAYKKYKGIGEADLKRILDQCSYDYCDNNHQLVAAIEEYAEKTEV